LTETLRTKRAFYRDDLGHCGVVPTVDEGDGIMDIRGDREHPLTRGYVCFKKEAHHGPARLLHPLRKNVDGVFAFDLARLEAIVESIPTVRSGVVSMAVGGCDLTGEESGPSQHGSSTNMFMTTGRHVDPLNAMACMSVIPVNVTRHVFSRPIDTAVSDPVHAS
jgi:hypothetical protein